MGIVMGLWDKSEVVLEKNLISGKDNLAQKTN